MTNLLNLASWNYCEWLSCSQMITILTVSCFTLAVKIVKHYVRTLKLEKEEYTDVSIGTSLQEE
jgi:hypothetical protein